MTFVGVPCIYYGDEIGMQGLDDPYNRMPYTWRCVDCETLEFYKRLTRLRNENPCLRTGAFIQLFADGDVYAYARVKSRRSTALRRCGLRRARRKFSERVLNKLEKIYAKYEWTKRRVCGIM